MRASPAETNVTAGTFPSQLQVKATQGNPPQLNPPFSLKRYWTLTETGDLTADLTFNYLDPTDVNGDPQLCGHAVALRGRAPLALGDRGPRRYPHVHVPAADGAGDARRSPRGLQGQPRGGHAGSA